MNCRNLAEELLNNDKKWETTSNIIEGEPFYWLGREPLPDSKIIFTHYDDKKNLENNIHFPLVLYFWAGLHNSSRSMMPDRDRTFNVSLTEDTTFLHMFSCEGVNARIQRAYEMSINLALKQGVHRINFLHTKKENVYRPVFYSLINIDGCPMKQITMIDKYFIFGIDDNTLEMTTTFFKEHEELGIDENERGTLVFFQEPNFLRAEVL